MGEMDKTKEQLVAELSQAQKRIAELEAVLVDNGKTHPVDYRTFKAFFESATDSFSIWNSNLNMVYLNDATLIKYYPPGTKRADVIGKHFIELVPGSVESGRYEKYLNVLNTGKPLYLEEFTPHPKFGVMYLAIKVFKIENGLGIITIDTTERKRMEQALQDSRQRLSALIDNAPDAIFTYDINGRITSVNKRAGELMGYAKEDIIGKPFSESDMFPPESRAKAKQRRKILKDGKTTELTQYELKAKDGSHIFVEVMGVPIVQGDKVEVIAIARDITKRKKAEEALRNSEEKLRAIFESIGDSITVIDGSGNIIEVNDAAINLFGCKSREEALGTQALSFIAEEYQPSAITKLQESKPTRFIEYRYKRMDGSLFWGETSSDVLYDQSGNITGFIGIVRDTTERKKTEDALRQSDEKLRRSDEKIRHIFDSVGTGISVTDMEGKVVEVNDFELRLCGCGKKEIIGHNGIGFIAERDRPRIIAEMISAFKTGKSGVHEFTALQKDGTEYETETIATVMRDSSGKPTGLITSVTDITERKRIQKELNDYKENLERMVQKRTAELEKTYQELRENEEALKESEEKYRSLIEQLTQGIIIIQDNRIVFANNVMTQINGYSVKEMLAMSPEQVINIGHPSNRNQLSKRIDERMQGKSIPEHSEWRVIHKDGTEKWLEAHATRIIFNGKPAIQTALMDITERKRMENALRNSEEKLRTMFTSMADGVVVTDLQGNFKDANIAVLNMFGYSSKADVLDANGFYFIAEKDRELAMSDMTQLFNEELVTGRSWTFKHSSGGEFQAELSTALLKDTQGNPSEILVVMRDITERKRMEEALRESEAKLRAIYNSIGDGITVTDLKGTILDQNEAGIQLSGYSRKADVNGRNGLSFIADADRDRAMNDMFNVLQKGIGITTEYKLVNRNGKEFDAEVSGALIPDSEGKPAAIVNVIRDITERKYIEEALRESEAKYRTLVEQSEQGICIFQDGCIVFANNALSKINGYRLKEMYAMSPNKLLLTVHPDDRETFVKRLQSRLQGDKLISKHEYRMIKKDGTERHLETYAKRIIYKGQPAIQSTIADITERKQWEEKLNKSKEELRFYLNQITKAQEEERKKIARELHDDTIQELITLARQIDNLIDKKIKPDADRRGSRKEIEAARQKVDMILQGVRRFTRDLRPSVLDDLGLVPALEWLTSDISNRFGIPINISIFGAKQTASPDAALAMFRIAQESLRNAGQHSKASQIQLNLRYSNKTTTLSIIDNGVGFSPPKQTASLTRHGQLGIAGMYERAQLIGATLSIKSKRNKGTTVSLELPTNVI